MSKPSNPRTKSESNALRAQRMQKIKNYTDWNVELYPESARVSHSLEQAIQLEDSIPDEGYAEETLHVAGRVKAKNVMGKASFFRIEDQSGLLQIYGSRDEMNERTAESYRLFKSLDIGDLIQVSGRLFRTRTGEVTLNVDSLSLLAKCIQPLPVVKEKDDVVYDAFEDKEQRYRRRYVDLIVNRDVRNDFFQRSRIISSIRRFLEDQGFLEVETPMLVNKPSGAAARPFLTHHNALNIPLYLRIAPELYLKRLIVGGFEKVFELNRNFRNEGLSRKHNPEFTMLEVYQAWANMDTMLQLTEDLVVHVCREIHGDTKCVYQGTAIDLTPPWPRSTWVDIIKEHSGMDFAADKSLEEWRQEAKKLGVEDTEKLPSKWKVADAVFDLKVEHKLVQPVFITHFPKELSPLAKEDPENPGYTKRFEPYCVGRELGNAFSELNDPFDQRARFEEQAAAKEEGDEEAMDVDEDYIYALECGMPPTGGLGIGVDRLVMLLLDKESIKDSILFPTLRPE
jgi:lysyl-tRNA synthetase class 2